ncbi:19916_t:CDS:1, partial [Gigaspora margarita]
KASNSECAHISINSIVQELEEFTYEDKWIDKLENEEKLHKLFYSDISKEDEELFYNSGWKII